MRCWFLSGNPRFATTHFAEHCRKLTRFPSSVSARSGYRLHGTWRRGGHLRLRREEHCGWRISVTGGETQQLLQTDFPPTRHCFETRGELSNCRHKLEYRICSTPLAQSHAYTKDPSAAQQNASSMTFQPGYRVLQRSRQMWLPAQMS